MKIETDILRNLNPEIDARNFDILCRLAQAYALSTGPMVGDYVQMPGEEHPRRFTHDWGDDIQTTCGPAHPCSGDQSFFLGEGFASFSGSLDPAIPKANLTELREVREARFWFFKDNYMTAHNGLHVRIPVRLYSYAPGFYDKARG